MPEPFSIAFTAIGTTLSVLGVVSSLLSTINDRFTSIADFPSRFPTLISRLEDCQKDIGEWDASWRYESRPDGTEINSKLWKTRTGFKEIQKKRERVDIMAQDIKAYVDKSLRIGGTSWGELDLNKLTRRQTIFLLLKSVRFAFFSEKTLGDRIGYLESAIDNLEKASESRQKELAGNNAPRVDDKAQRSRRLTDLEGFGQAVWDLGGTYSEWTLELRPVGWGDCTSVLEWGSLVAVHIRILFHAPGNALIGHNPTYRRVGLDYTLGSGPHPKRWADILAAAALPPNLAGNPKITSYIAPSRRTRAFRDLFFPDNFFGQLPVYELWKRDLAYLLVSLTNWSGLLWNTNWTTNLCTSRIRFASTETPGPSVHTLCSRGDHAPDVDLTPLRHCGHGSPEQKLRNLGLVLAELICANPLRLVGAGYKRWDTGSRSWADASTDEILYDVEQKSGSIDVREAVQFCLEAPEGRGGTDGHAAFLHRFTTKVVKP